MRLAEAFVRAGKVRDLYRVGDDRLLLVASDRLSAFDVVLPTPIPDKGRVLTGLSRFWFARDGSIVPNHLLSTDPADVPRDITDGDPDVVETLRGRMMLGRLAEVLPIECVVRGYLSGSGWTAYLKDGAVCGIPLPAAPPRERPAAGPDLHPGHEGADGRARREHPVRERRDAHRAGARVPGPRHVARAVRARRRGVRAGRDHPRGHEVRVRPAALGRAAADRRGHDARLVAVLGRDDLSSRPRGRPASTSSTSATGCSSRTGTAPRPARRSRSTSWPAPAPATSPPSSGSPAPASTAISRRT